MRGLFDELLSRRLNNEEFRSKPVLYNRYTKYDELPAVSLGTFL